MSGSLNRVKEVVSKVRHIEEEAAGKGSSSAKYITDRCNTIAKGENIRLNVKVDNKTGELLTKPACSYRYYSQLMENYRSGIKALNFKHHAIERYIAGFIKKYGSEKPELISKLDASLPIKTLRENIILLRADSVTGSEFRADLLSLKIEHHAFYMFEPKGAIKDWISDDNKKQLNKKLHSQILVNSEWVKKLTNDLLKNKNSSVSELCIGIALATGRRLTEVMKTAKLKRFDERTLIFSGQLKTKNRHLFEEIKAYKIPSLVNAELVIKALTLLRKRTGKDLLSYNDVLGETVKSTVMDGDIRDYYHNRAVHKKYESTVNRTVRSTLQNGHFSLKDCRALYTEITYEEHAEEGESRSAYRHRVLGHSLIETQLHYESFKVNDSIDTIKLVVKNNNDEQDENKQQALVNYLKLADATVSGYARAPKIAIMHTWLKNEIDNGLLLEQITPSYIRRHCLIEGKQLNLNTIKKYLSEFVQLDDYEPPKKKPQGKLEKDIAELEAMIYDNQERCESISTERENLEIEQEEIKQRLNEIDEKDEELELEYESIDGEINEYQTKLSELQAQLEKNNISKSDDEIALVWPAAENIEIFTKKDGKKWLVWADVNDTTFELIVGGRKPQAINDFKAYYNKEISK